MSLALIIIGLVVMVVLEAGFIWALDMRVDDLEDERKERKTRQKMAPNAIQATSEERKRGL